MKKILLLLCALLGTVGAMATDVKIANTSSGLPTAAGFGSFSGQVFTTASGSGLAGVTVTAATGVTIGEQQVNVADYGNCFKIVTAAAATNYQITLAAPDGYVITGYALDCSANTKNAVHTLTSEDGTVSVVASAPIYNSPQGPKAFVVNGLEAQSTYFTINTANQGNTLYLPTFTISVVQAGAQIVNVAYKLYESDGTTEVSGVASVVKEQEAGSDPDIPSTLTSNTYYDYTTDGTIGNSDCTIKVIRTLKAGYVISLDGLSNSKCYNIRNNRGTWAVGSGATVVNSTVELGLAFLASDTKQQFAFITYEGNVYLYSVGEGKFAYVDGTKLSLTADVTSAVAASPVTFQTSTASSANAEPIIVTVGGQMYGVSTGKSPDVFLYNVANDGGNSAIVIEAGSFDATAALAALDEYFHPNYTVTYIVKDGSNNILFTSEPVPTTNGANITTLPAEYQKAAFYTYNNVDVTISATGNTNVEFTATPKENAPVQYTSDATSPIYYNLNIRSKYLVYNNEATGEVALQSDSEPFNADASWAFIGNPYTGFKLINKTKGVDSYLTYTSVITANNAGNNNIQFVDDANFTNQYWIIDTNSNGLVLRMKENNSIYFHHDNSYNLLRTCSVNEWAYVHTDAGSTIQAVSDNDVLFTLYDAIKNITYGEGLGEYTAAGISIANAQATIANVGNVINASMTSAYADAYAALKVLADATDINLPAGKFIRLYSPTSNLWMGSAASGKHPMVENKADAGIYYVTSDNHIISYNQGLALANGAGAPCDAVGAAGGQFTFGAVDYAGTYYVYCGGYIIAWTDNYTNRNGAYDNKADWNFEEVTTLPVAISAAGYATLYAPVALTVPSVPSGVTANTAALNGNIIELTTVGETIPAGTPVILEGAEGSYDFAIDATNADAAIANALTGVYAAIAAPNNSYILQKQNDKVGFYQVDVTEATPKVPGFRAYIPAQGGEVKAFFFGEADGISSVENGQLTKDNEAIFNIAGQRVAKAQKGIYIMNGKKVLVK